MTSPSGPIDSETASSVQPYSAAERPTLGGSVIGMPTFQGTWPVLTHLDVRGHDSNRLSTGAFTLAEVLVVIGILALLAVVIAFAVSGNVDNGMKSSCNTDARTVESAIQSYHAHEGQWPGSSSDLIPRYLDADRENIAVVYVSASRQPALEWDSTGGSKCTAASTGRVTP